MADFNAKLIKSKFSGPSTPAQLPGTYFQPLKNSSGRVTQAAVSEFMYVGGLSLPDPTSEGWFIGGGNNGSPGAGSLVFGYGAQSEGAGALSVGYEALANSDEATSVGRSAVAGSRSVVVGKDASGDVTQAVVIGWNASALSAACVAIGPSARVTASAVVIGANAGATTTGTNSVLIGSGVNAGANNVVIGLNGSGSGTSSVGIGRQVSVATFGVAIGMLSSAVSNSIAVGYGATAASANQLVFGSSTVAISQLVIGPPVTNHVDFVADFGCGDGTNKTNLRLAVDTSANRIYNFLEKDSAGDDSFASVSSQFAFGRKSASTDTISRTTDLKLYGGNGSVERTVELGLSTTGAMEVRTGTVGSETTKLSVESSGDVRTHGVSGNYLGVKWAEETVNTTSGSSASTSGAARVPAYATLLYVSVRIQTTITGPTTVDVGVSGDTQRFDTLPALTSGTAQARGDHTGSFPRYYTSQTAIQLTAVGGNFTAGAVKVAIAYIEASPQTS